MNLNQTLDSLNNKKILLRTSNVKQRITKLKKLKSAIVANEDAICKALYNDLRKSKEEAFISELLPVYSEINFIIKKLNGWMHPLAVAGHFPNLTGSNYIYYEPKGVCLIISPWNYPFQLTISPLICAIAAGNTCLLKPSEHSVSTSNILEKIISDTFDKDEITLVNGGVEVSQQLLDFPFDHIFYTGSTAVGKIVMQKAAQNLSSVTLELGGKSPVIIDDTANLKDAAKKIMWAKLMNAGQTCIAPDYVLINENKKTEFVKLAIEAVNDLYPDLKKNATYCKIINQNHFNRLKKWLDEAKQKGAEIYFEGGEKSEEHLLFPVIIGNVDASSSLSCDEIFGPILPIVTYKNLQEAIDYINKKEKPLAFYAFSNSSKNKEKFLKEISAGGVCINDLLLHIANPNLPFGGVNHSGIGNYHGWFGFKAFSNEKAVFKQAKINFTSLIMPPYKTGIINLIKKFF